MKKYSLLILILSFSFVLNAQEAFDEEVLNQTLKEEVNQFRYENDLEQFKASEILDAVAFDQAEFILQKGQVTHEQDKASKKTLLDRILYYEGLYGQAGENAAMIDIGSKAELEPGGEKQIVDNQVKVAKAAITAWLEDEESNLNLTDSNFLHFGSAAIMNEKKVILVLVTTNLPYESHQGEELAFDNYGIETYKDEACKSLLDEHGTLPQLFSDAIEVEKGEAFFSFHSKAFVEKIFENGGDGMALDIICNDQFNCGESNRFFPGEVSNGYMMKPVKKMKVLNANLGEDIKGVHVSLGKLPSFYSSESCELNLIIIKDGVKCETVPYNKIYTKNLRKVEQSLLLIGDTLEGTYSWKDSINYHISLNQTQSEVMTDLQSLNELLEDLNFTTESSKLTSSVSPADQNINTKLFEENIAASLSKFTSSTEAFELSTAVAWEAYNKFQENNFYQLETQEMGKAAKVEYLKKTREEDEKLDAFLDSLNYLEVKLKGTASISTEAGNEKLAELVKVMSEQLKVKPAATIQRYLINQVLNGEIDKSAIPKTDPEQRKFSLPLINNKIVMEQSLGATSFEGNPIHKAFLELYLIDKNLAVLTYNYHLSTLNYWASNTNEIKNIEDWLDEFEKLRRSNQIPAKAFARALLSYHIIAADYFYEKQKYKERREAFDEIMKWQEKAELNAKEKLELAYFLCHQDQFHRAIRLLKPIVKTQEPQAEILFYYLQILPYDQKQFTQKQYFDLFRKAQSIYPKEFCNFFGKQKQGIQPLEYLEVKDLYCSHCKQ